MTIVSQSNKRDVVFIYVCDFCNKFMKHSHITKKVLPLWAIGNRLNIYSKSMPEVTQNRNQYLFFIMSDMF